jgi:hypothetical protein
LVVRIAADASQLQAEMQKASGVVKQSAGEMGGAFETLKDQIKDLIPELSAAAFVEFAKGALEAADNLYIMGQRTGFAADTLSKLNIPLKQNGSSVDEFSASMKFLSRNIELAAEGNPLLIKAFNDLGLSVTKLKELTPEDQFYAVANAMSQVTDQGKFTADGMAIMGRGFASVAPLIKAAAGNMADFVGQMDGLTTDEINKVHEYDDAWVSFWEHMKIHSVEATVAVGNFFEFMKENVGTPATNAKSGMPGDNSAFVYGPNLPKGSASTDRPDTVSSATYLASGFGDLAQDKSARGSNDNLTQGDDTPEVADQVPAYIDKLNGEAEALSLSKTQLALYRAEQEGVAKAQEEVNDGIRDKAELTPQETKDIDDATLAYLAQKQAMDDLRQAQEDHAREVRHLEEQLSTSLANVATNYKSFGDTIKGVIQSIANEIIKSQITSPLSKSIMGALPGLGSIFGGGSTDTVYQGFGDDAVGLLQGFAGGGSPPVGVPSIVGENGPELFVPNSAGTIIPNGGLGGSNVVVNQYFNMAPGLPETVNAAVRSAAPSIAAAAHASVFAAMQKGGSESKIAGLRN